MTGCTDDNAGALTDAARAAVEQNRFLRRRIRAGGVLHIERRLPFFVVYRRPAKQLDKGMARLVTTMLAELVRPKLAEDGMFLVGLDIVGDKLMEINVFSPGGLHSINKLYETNFATSVIESIESKVDYMRHYRREFSNRIIATL